MASEWIAKLELKILWRQWNEKLQENNNNNNEERGVCLFFLYCFVSLRCTTRNTSE